MANLVLKFKIVMLSPFMTANGVRANNNAQVPKPLISVWIIYLTNITHVKEI